MARRRGSELEVVAARADDHGGDRHEGQQQGDHDEEQVEAFHRVSPPRSWYGGLDVRPSETDEVDDENELRTLSATEIEPKTDHDVQAAELAEEEPGAHVLEDAYEMNRLAVVASDGLR